MRLKYGAKGPFRDPNYATLYNRFYFIGPELRFLIFSGRAEMCVWISCPDNDTKCNQYEHTCVMGIVGMQRSLL